MEDYVRTISDSHPTGEVIEDSDLGPSQRSIEADEGVVIGSTNATEEAPSEVAPTGNLVAEDDEEDMEEDDDEEDEYEYEDEDDVGLSSFLVDNPSFAVDAAIRDDDKKPTKIEEEQLEAPKQKWRQPSKEAVNLSLQAEKVKSGGRRRLLQDLCKIMSEDNDEAGFKIKPSDEDCMDKWTVQLFKFDEDSNLAKDMKVLGLTNIELEFAFPDQYPFEPPFVRVLRPRFKRQTGFVMNGALCMELLTKVCANPNSLYFNAPHMQSFSHRMAGIQSTILKA